MWECDSCYDRFYHEWQCDEHMDEERHHACAASYCNRQFGSQRAAEQHMNTLGHWAVQYHCHSCAYAFPSISARDTHHDEAGHWEHYCSSCKRAFGDANQLKMHLTSKIHVGSNATCPFCTRAYTTASGLSHHLERGACPRAPALNRETIHEIIRQRDTNGLITQKQIGWNSNDHVVTTATAASWNGNSYECYLCHRGFGSLFSLNQHLASPAHKSSIYHCPNTRCGSEFKTLAGLFGHLESESCNFMRFGSVQQQVKNVFASGRTLTFG